MAEKSKKAKKRLFGKAISGSVILRFLDSITYLIYSKAEESAASSFITGYDFDSRKYKNSFFGRLLKRMKIGQLITKPFKKRISYLVNTGIFVNAIIKFFNSFLQIKTKKYGQFFGGFGMGCIAVYLIRFFVRNIAFDFNGMFFCAAVFVLSLPLMFNENTIAKTLSESKIGSFLSFEFFAGKKEVFESFFESKKSNANTALFLGVIYGLLSYFVRPLYLFGIFPAVLLSYIVLCSPECGVCLLLLCLPFLKSEILSCLSVVLFICWFLKYIRAKRTLKTDAVSLCALFYGVLLLLGKIIYGNSGEEYLQALFMLFGFFAAVNLIKSDTWARKCENCAVLSCSVAAVLRVVCTLAELFAFSGFVSGMCGKLLPYLPSVLNIGDCIILCLPLIFKKALRSRTNGKKLIFTVLAVVDVLCLLTETGFGSVVGIAVGLVLFSLFYGRKSFSGLILGVVGFGICYVVLPSGIKNYLATELSVFGIKPVFNISGGITGEIYILCGILGCIFFVSMLFFLISKGFSAAKINKGEECRQDTVCWLSGLIALVVNGLFVPFEIGVNAYLLFWIFTGICSSRIDCAPVRKSDYYTE